MLFLKTVKFLSVGSVLVTTLGTDVCASDDLKETNETFGGFPKGFLFSNTRSAMPEKRQQSTPQKTEPVPSKEEKKQPTSPNFGGFKQGFLTSSPPNNTSEKTQRKAVSKNTQKTTCNSPSLSISISSNSEINEEGPTDYKVPKSLWDHPYPYTKEARQKLYQSFPLNMEGIVELMEEKLGKLFSPTKEGIASVCSNPNFLAYFIAFKYLFENFSLYKERAQESVNLEKAQPVSFIMQVIEHQVLKSYFQHMESLPSMEEKKRFKQIFITEESDHHKGEFVFEKGLWSQLANGSPKPCVRYFADSLGLLNPIYHLYFEEAQGLINFSRPITNNPSIGFRGDFDLIEFISRDHFNTAGYILDDNRSLVTTPGLIFAKREFGKTCEFLCYDRHPVFDQMFFYEVASVFNRNQVDPQLEPFLGLIGGIERLDRDDFVFIPTPNPETDTTVSPSTARLVLPYLYELKEAAQENLTYTLHQIGWIDDTINVLKTILVEDICAQKDETLDEIIRNELLEEEMQQASNSEDTKRGEAEKEPIQTHTNARLKEGSQTRKKSSKMQVKKKKVGVIDPQVTQQRRKEKILAHIEEEYREKASKKKNFSSHEVRELLGEMVEDLSPLGIERTGESHSHGSHAAIQIEDKTSSRSTHLGIANRPQKRGYQSGTVKTIIKDMIQKVSLIVLKETS